MADTSKLADTNLNNGQASVQAGAWTETRAAGEAAREGAEAMQHNGRVAGEAMRRGASATVDATRQGTQASVEAMRRVSEQANETVRRTTQAVAEGQRQIAQDAAKKFEDVSHRVAHAAQDTSESVRKLMTLPHAAEGGLSDMRQGMAGLVEGVVQTNLRATQELLRLTNPAAMIELQQRFMREYMDALMQGTATLVRAVRRTADETLPPLEAQIEQRQQARRVYRTAAE
jgi:hypothetical protein